MSTGTAADLGDESRERLELMVMGLREDLWRLLPIVRAEGYVRRHEATMDWDDRNMNDWVKGTRKFSRGRPIEET